MVILLAHYKRRSGADTETLGRLWTRMHEIASSSPEYEFLGYRVFSADDGSALTIYEFGSLEGLERFRAQPEHVTVQQRGNEFFEWLRNDVCVVERRDDWTPGAGSAAERPSTL